MAQAWRFFFKLATHFLVLRKAFTESLETAVSFEGSTHRDITRYLLKIQAACAELDETQEGAEHSARICGSINSYWPEESSFPRVGRQVDPVGRRLEQRWFADVEHVTYPWPNLLGLILFIGAVILIWEGGWLKSTIAPGAISCAVKKKKADGATENLEDGFGLQEITTFWEGVHEWNTQGVASGFPRKNGDELDYVRFTSRVFTCICNQGSVTIGVERTGSCQGELVVKVKASERDTINFAAKAGEAFQQVEVFLTFKNGEQLQTFDVKVFKPNSWDPGRWFRVELISVVSGTAHLYPQRHARVLLVDTDYKYPGGKSLPKGDFNLTLVWEFIRECKHIRGKKFQRTMLGMLYMPFHKVVVVSLVEKFMIDWATNPNISGDCHTYILCLAACLFLSMLLYRWGDQMQTKNRGRTGGIRQTHRLWLFEKLLMLASVRNWQWHIHGSEWMYGALYDVNTVTIDIYWQYFIACQSLFGLVLTVFMVIFLDIYRAVNDRKSYEAGFILPSAILLLLVPLGLGACYYRRHRIMNLVLQRQREEEKWIEFLSWFAHSENFAYGFGFREIASYEAVFRDFNTRFLKHHQEARDGMNDANWATKWLCDTCYLVILIWGAFALYSSRAGHDSNHLEVGQYAVLLKLFYKFGSYLVKLNACFVHVLRGSVSLEKLQKLMNLPCVDQHANEHDTGLHSSAAPLAGILMEKVHYAFFSGPFRPVLMRNGTCLDFKLGSFIQLQGSDEATALTVCALIGGVLQPTRGMIVAPQSAMRIMVPAIVVSSAVGITVQQELEFVGIDPSSGNRFLRALGLDPEMQAHTLPPGAAKLLALARALLRDPEILILSWPLAHVPKTHRRKIVALLRLWQSDGGARAILRRLADNDDTKERLAQEVPQRTLICFGDADESSFDTVLNLDEFMMESDALHARSQTLNSESVV